MRKSSIYIIGSGAVGKALAVFLQHEKRQVVLVRGSIDNKPDVKDMITVINHENQEFKQKITITTLNNLAIINGIVVIAAKSFANPVLAEKLKEKKGDFSIVLLQNGLNIEKPFKYFGKVFRCVLFSTSQVRDENCLTFKTVTASPIGSLQGENAILDFIVEQLNTRHFSFRSEPNILKYVWEKVIINCAFNSICPLLESDNGIFYRNIEAAKQAKTVIGECVAVASKCGIQLNMDEIEEKLLLISMRSEGQLISTYEDIRKKRRTEIDSLNLEVSRLADELGMPELTKNTRLLGKLIQIKSGIKNDLKNQNTINSPLNR